MMISELIGKQIVSPQGRAVGYVTDVRPARGFCGFSCLVFADTEEEENYLPVRAVLAMGDAVIAGKARLSAPTGLPSPVGLPAFANEGVSLGNVTDLDLASGELLFSGGSRAPAKLIAMGESAIVYPTEHARIRAGRISPQKSPKKPSAPARAPGQNEDVPKSVSLLGRDLLGKYVKSTVYGKTGLPIAERGQKVTPALLSSARREGKLLELTVCTLTDVFGK